MAADEGGQNHLDSAPVSSPPLPTQSGSKVEAEPVRLSTSMQTEECPQLPPLFDLLAPFKAVKTAAANGSVAPPQAPGVGAAGQSAGDVSGAVGKSLCGSGEGEEKKVKEEKSKGEVRNGVGRSSQGVHRSSQGVRVKRNRPPPKKVSASVCTVGKYVKAKRGSVLGFG